MGAIHGDNAEGIKSRENIAMERLHGENADTFVFSSVASRAEVESILDLTLWTEVQRVLMSTTSVLGATGVWGQRSSSALPCR